MAFLSEPQNIIPPVLIGSKAPLKLWLELRKDSEKLEPIGSKGREVSSHDTPELVTGARESFAIGHPIVTQKPREHPKASGGQGESPRVVN